MQEVEKTTPSVEVSKSDRWQEEEDDEDWDDDESRLCCWILSMDPWWGCMPTPTKPKRMGFQGFLVLVGFMFA